MGLRWYAGVFVDVYCFDRSLLIGLFCLIIGLFCLIIGLFGMLVCLLMYIVLIGLF